MAGRGRYHLYAYVCDAGCVKWSTTEGTVPFSTVFVARPHTHCRYAVLGEWDPVNCRERVLVVDIDQVHLRGNTRVIMPEPVRVCDTVDQAIMSTLMLYEQHEQLP